MKVLVDLNVLMDVLQRRDPFFASAAALCAWGEKRQNTLAVPAHAVTTVSYIVRKTAGAEAEGKALDWLLGNFAVIPADAAVFRFARTLGMEDFEDAVVAASAATSGCAHIITRNVADFQKSPVPALQPAEFLSM
jgi:predicted nucleic acid-binding protein